MQMTFQQYIDNPLGKKNAVFSQRELYKGLYTSKFDKVLLREAGNLTFTMYNDKKNDRYIMHIKVPSETVKDFYYDAVILFYTDDAKNHSDNHIKDYYVKFFSNDPAFVFTYLRVFLKNDMFFEDLKPKSSKLALTKDPKEKNPYEIPGYSKILYFAYLYMKTKNLFAKHMWTTYGQDYSVKKLLAAVEHTDEKIARRQELGAQKEPKETKAPPKPREFPTIRKSSDTDSTTPTSGVRIAKNAKSVKNTLKAKVAKTSKVVKKK